jgi:hypothetical protein
MRSAARPLKSAGNRD